MGSFLISCGLTNQSLSDDEVYIIPIIENKHSNALLDKDGNPYQVNDRLCYNTDLYRPLGVMFSAKYYDYGRYEIEWNDTNKQLLVQYFNYLKEHCISQEMGENQYHDPAIDLNKYSLEDVWTQAQEIWDYIHEAIWECRLIAYPMLPYHKTPSKVDYFVVQKQYAEILINKFINRPVDNYAYSEWRKKHTEFRLMSLEDKYKHLKKYYNNTDIYNPYRSDEYYWCLNRSGGGSSAWLCISDIKAQVFMSNLKDDLALNLFTSYYYLEQLIVAMSYMNAYPIPVYYSSQDYSNVFGITYLEFMNEVKELVKTNIDLEYLELDDNVEMNEAELDSYFKEIANRFDY